MPCKEGFIKEEICATNAGLRERRQLSLDALDYSFPLPWEALTQG